LRSPAAVSALAGGTLVAGFAVAEGTGVRALGGLVLVVGAAVCARAWRRRLGPGRTIGLLAVFLLSFVLAHVLAPVLGAWPAVLVVAAEMGVVSLTALVRTDAAAAAADASPRA
jgi:hypothetical protein